MTMAPTSDDIEALPDGRADPLFPPRSDVLRDEGAHVAGSPDEQTHQSVVQDAGGRRGGKAAGEYQARNMRSTKCWSDHEPVLRISGNAMSRICR